VDRLDRFRSSVLVPGDLLGRTRTRVLYNEDELTQTATIIKDTAEITSTNHGKTRSSFAPMNYDLSESVLRADKRNVTTAASYNRKQMLIEDL
jgi:hypothetical protein